MHLRRCAAGARSMSTLIAIVAALGVGQGCGDSAARGIHSSDTAKPDSPSAAPSTATSPPASAHEVASTAPPTVAFGYTGPFEAKKRKVQLPSGVVDPAWQLDSGKKYAGPGTLEVSVWSDGRVTGKAAGALGDLVIEGTAETGSLTASLGPASGNGFRGVLTGRIEGDDLKIHLSAASSDAQVVREADAVLHAAKR